MNLHDSEERYIDVYNSVIKLIYECQRFNSSEKIKQNKKIYSIRQQVIEDFSTVKVKTHRDSGMTTIAVRLLRKDPDSILLVPTFNSKRYLRDKLSKEELFRVIVYQDIQKEIQRFRGIRIIPELVIVDDASYLDRMDLSYNSSDILTNLEKGLETNLQPSSFLTKEEILKLIKKTKSQVPPDKNWRQEVFEFLTINGVDIFNIIKVELG